MWDPQVAGRDCQHCLKYDYDEKTGEPEVDDATGELIERLPPDPRAAPLGWAPCRLHAALPAVHRTPCPKGTPEQPHTLDERNARAYQHYRECRAVGQFPDDSLVRRHAAIIRDVEDDFEAYRRELEAYRRELVALESQARAAHVGPT